jgi:hypothetical protein
MLCAADDNAICKSQGSASLHTQWWELLWHSLVYGRSRPKHALFEGLLELTEHEKLEANWLIQLKLYEL